ncbi:hypothetical protein ACEWY4_022223 [Coilia grayii]|uniref:Uncharacterized protein n=1 Tax=Coilia grayii TaxID=363190 RepID=A0ABD1J794_9TELE
MFLNCCFLSICYIITHTDGSDDKNSAKFNVTLNASFKATQLEKVIGELEHNSTSTITVETEGLVEMSIHSESEPYTLSCQAEDMMSECSWSIRKESEEVVVWNGSTATVRCVHPSTSSTQATLSLSNPDRLWSGLYTCTLRSGRVLYKASGDLPIPLPPDLTLKSNPENLDCSSDAKQRIRVNCSVSPPSDVYNITLYVLSDKKTEVMSKDAVFTGDINCKDVADYLNTACEVTNNPDEKHFKTLTVPVITSTDDFCDSVSEWPRTKKGVTATRSCEPGRVGQKNRTCKGKHVWGPVENYCAREEIAKLLNKAENLAKGFGVTPERIREVFLDMKNFSDPKLEPTLGDVTSLINTLDYMKHVSKDFVIKSDSDMEHFIDASSSILSMHWSDDAHVNQSLSAKYLQAVEGLTQNIQVNQSTELNSTNLLFQLCPREPTCSRNLLGINVALISSAQQVKLMAIDRLTDWLPNDDATTVSCSDALVVVQENASREEDPGTKMTIEFPLTSERPQNHKIVCVYWQTSNNTWAREGCRWIHKNNTHALCECDRASLDRTGTARTRTFSTLMSRVPVELDGLNTITLVGLGASICSLIIFLAIECFLWKAVAKTKLSHFRHTALVNIATFLLLADCIFLASAVTEHLPEPFCLILAVAKHFFYLAMFFWMLCLSIVLLHQVIFIFQPLRAKVFFTLSATIGYICPLVTVGIAYVYYEVIPGSGDSSSYHNRETCWLTYKGSMKGSIYSFMVPVGVITLMNLFSMVVVIVTLLRPTFSESKTDDREMVKSIIKVIVILSPIFGVTWALGFGVFVTDLTDGPLWMIINYAFTITNTFQGFFILLTGCIGERKVREEFLKTVSLFVSSSYHLHSDLPDTLYLNASEFL